MSKPKQRVAVYIDGFNLYFGLKSKGWQRYYWLDVKRLAEGFLRDDQELVKVAYFTSRISFPSDKARRQSLYLDALQTHAQVEIFYGQYQSSEKTCRSCGSIHRVNSEKETDVNIALEVMQDGYEELYDVAIIISGDSDLSPVIKKLRQKTWDKRFIIFFPPDRTSQELRRVAHSNLVIGRKAIANSLLPLEILKPNGYLIVCPPRWRAVNQPALATQ